MTRALGFAMGADMGRFDLSTTMGRFQARWHYFWADHAFLRVAFSNAHWLGPDLVRTNQPSPRQLAHWKKKGVRTVINLRGRRDEGYYWLERDACERLGLTLIDAPLDSRQLRRLSLRAGAGLARTGSVFGHGSGDIALAFSTAYTIPQLADAPMPAMAMLHEARIDPLFEAAAEACEQAIISALWHAEAVTGRDGHRRDSIRQAAPDWRQWLSDTEF